MDDAPSKFIYICPQCHSFQFSDIATCAKCGSPSPDHKDAGDSQAGTSSGQLGESRPDEPNDSGIEPQETDRSPLSRASESLSWLQVWKRVLTTPTVGTFEQLARDANATTRRAYSWIFGAFFFGYGFSSLIDKIAHGSSTSEILRTLFLVDHFLVGGLLLGGLASVVVAIIITSISHSIAKTLGGTGSFPKLFFAFAASLAPATLIMALLSSIPILGNLAYPLCIYVVVLNVLAVRAVHRLEWKKAVLSNLHIMILMVAVPATLLYVVEDLAPLVQQLATEFETPVNVSWEKSLQKGGGTNLVVEVPSEAIDWVESRDQFACRMAAFARARYRRPEAVKAVRVAFSSNGQQAGFATLTTYDKVYLWEVTDPDFLACKPGLSDAEKHFGTGAKLDGQGRSPEALVEYNEAIRLSPQYAVAYNNRGTVYNELGQYRRAIEDFNEAIRLNPSVAIIYLNRGFSYDHLTQYKRAIQDFDEAIRLNAQLAPPYALRALAYTRLGMDSQARQDMEMAAKHGVDPISLKPGFRSRNVKGSD